MYRRKFLSISGTATGLALTGCTSNNGNGGEDGGNEETQKTEELTLTDILQIENHKWLGASLLEVTVRNRLSEELDLVQVEADVYVGNERINHAYTNISSLPPETVQTSEIRFTEPYGQDPCNADRYELVPNLTYELNEYQQRIEFQFDPSFCD